MSPNVTTDPTDGGGRFNTTRWGLIRTSLEEDIDEAKAREALSQLCRIYWRPIFAFVQRGRSTEDAQDLTQEFFVYVLKGDLLRRADPERGRFRSLLLKSVQNFLLVAKAKVQTKKRGGEVQFVSWDEWMAEAPSQLAIPASAVQNWPAERIYDVRWAATVAERALRCLQEECERRGRRRVFDVLSTALTADRVDVSYVNMARELRIEPSQVRRLLHKLRLRYRQLLCAEVAETVSQPGEVDEELRYLISVLSANEEETAEP